MVDGGHAPPVRVEGDLGGSRVVTFEVALFDAELGGQRDERAFGGVARDRPRRFAIDRCVQGGVVAGGGDLGEAREQAIAPRGRRHP